MSTIQKKKLSSKALKALTYEFTEFSDCLTACKKWGYDEVTEEDAELFLKENSVVIHFVGGVLVRAW